MKPLGSTILIKRDEPPKISKGGIIIPATVKDEPFTATIISIGDKVKVEVSVGEKIIIGQWSGHPFKIDREDFLVIKEEDVLAIVEK